MDTIPATTDLTGLIEEFLAGYGSAATRAAYRSDLSLWATHCRSGRLEPLQARRGDIEGYARQLEADGLAPATVNRRLATITGFYRWTNDEGLVAGNPAANVRRPRRPADSPRQALSRTEMKDWLDAAEAEGGHAYGLACLLAINGLRVGEACGTNVGDLAADRWHHTLTIRGKGDKPAVVPLPPRTIAALNAGVSLRDVQEFARHADPRTTIRYDRARHSLDRHASYTVMQYVSGAA